MLLLVFPGTAKEVDAEKIKKRYESIFQAFGDRVTFIILANKINQPNDDVARKLISEFETAIADSHLAPNHHVVVVGNAKTVQEDGCVLNLKHGKWAQDPFVVLQEPGGQTVLLEPMFHPDQENSLIAEQLASSTNILLRPTRYFIEGGNILVGDDFALLGKAILEKNRQAYFSHLSEEKGREAVTAELKRVLGLKYLFWVGFDSPTKMPFEVFQDPEKLQHFFHLDLFITLGGKDIHSGDETVFIPKPKIENTILNGDDKDKWKAEFNRLVKVFDDLAQFFKEIHEKAPGPKFKVERIAIGIEISAEGKADIYSYNNAHVEWYHGIKRIYLPHYPKFKGKGTEDGVRRLLEGLGYRVVFIQNAFDDYMKYGHGSLHCLSKVLLREHY